VVEIASAEPFSPMYPARLLQGLGTNAPAVLCWVGEPLLLQVRALGLVCSVRCPGDVVLKTHDLAKALRDARIPVIGGFHSPMEKKCLSILLSGTQPVVLCLARGLEQLRTPPAWKDPLAKGRLLILSGLDSRFRRVTARAAALRNRHVVALADQLLVSHAARGGQTERLVDFARQLGKQLWTVESPYNQHMVAMGARPVTAETVSVLRDLSTAPTSDAGCPGDQYPLPLPSCGSSH
jgi:predicted Rossmann fold nucleotide-binding protein DprA/Smf involved in DNA uptake